LLERRNGTYTCTQIIIVNANPNLNPDPNPKHNPNPDSNPNPIPVHDPNLSPNLRRSSKWTAHSAAEFPLFEILSLS